MKVTKKILENVADQLEDNLSKIDFIDNFIPFMIDCLEYFSSQLDEEDIQALIISKQYWIEKKINDAELKKERGRYFKYTKTITFNDYKKRAIASGISFLLYPYETDDDCDNFVWLHISALLNADMPYDTLYDKIISNFSSSIDLEEIAKPDFSDPTNRYDIIDYSLYSEEFGENYNRLLLRSPKTKDRKFNIDIVIFSPSKLVLPAFFNGLEIDELDKDDDKDIVSKLVKEFKFNIALRIFSLKTEGVTYYVNCSNIGIYNNNLGLKESSVDRYTRDNRGENILFL